MIEPGTQIGAYRVMEKLGEGGMGVVYRAIDTTLQRPVAIKTLLAGPNADSVARFVREAKAASRLQHSTIVTIHHIGLHEQTHYIVMELVEGQTLKRLIGGRPMNLRQACDIAIQVCEGLAVAHDAGVVHRDIKAENIIVTPRGGVKILDFGLAKLAETQAADAPTIARTEAGVVMGTVSHMSPEQAMGREVDSRSDIFSFGVMFYEVITGRMPFAAQTPQAMLARVLNHDPEPASLANPAVTPDLEQISRDCLQKDRALRPTAHELVTMLGSARDGLSGRASGSALGAARAAAPGSAPVRVASTASGTARPASGAMSGQAPHSGARAAGADASAGNAGPTTGMYAAYWALRTVGVLVATVTATVPLAFLLHFFIGGGVIRPELVADTFVMQYVTAIVAPVLQVAEQVLTFRTVVGGGWNLLLPLAAIAAFALRRVVQLPIERAEHWAKERIARATPVETRGTSVPSATRVTDQRMAMLREYAETKKLLFQQKRRIAFLSVDVLNAARMKSGEDKLVIEHAFAEYRKYIERAITGHNVWKRSWRGDRTLCAFFTIDAAARAAQQIVAELAWFNDGVHQTRQKFEVRCGLAVGDVVFPEEKRLEEVTDEAVDLADALCAAAPAGALWITREAQAEIADGSGFAAIAQSVMGQDVLEWRPGIDPASTPGGDLSQAASQPDLMVASGGGDATRVILPP